jgi:hypothetical protein
VRASARYDSVAHRPSYFIITLEIAGRATPLCYASSER